MKLFATDVFTPNDFPAYTYVQRSGDDLETQLHRALDTPKVVVSISGPSKSGKTVLVEKVVGESWSRKSAQDDKWSFCLTTGTLCPANQERP
jgi:hypothetical protein